jgi:hypothetical protein
MRVWPVNAVRDSEGADTLEVFLVAAVVALLAIRTFLALTGYPQIGGSTLHIAHMLWGGLLMLAGLMLLIGFWNPGVRVLAGLVGGMGFGTFIDELGKFITRDNDYFFQPTIALIYAIFVALFLVVRILYSRRPLSEHERRVNAELRAVLGADGQGEAGTDVFRRLAGRLARRYERIVLLPLFRTAITVLFAAVAVSRVATVLGIELFGRHPGGATVEGIRALATAANSAFVVIGALLLRRSRLQAYRWFQRALLVSILVIQFFVFLESQLLAVGGLAVDLLLYSALGFMIRREQATTLAADRDRPRA